MKITIPIGEREKAVELALTTRRADRTELLGIIERDILVAGAEREVDQDVFARLVFLRAELRQAFGMPGVG